MQRERLNFLLPFLPCSNLPAFSCQSLFFSFVTASFSFLVCAVAILFFFHFPLGSRAYREENSLQGLPFVRSSGYGDQGFFLKSTMSFQSRRTERPPLLSPMRSLPLPSLPPEPMIGNQQLGHSFCLGILVRRRRREFSLSTKQRWEREKSMVDHPHKLGDLQH